MINLSNNNEFYVVKFNNDQYLIILYDIMDDCECYYLTSKFDSDMFFRNYDNAKSYADNFMNCNKNNKDYKISSYTIHKVQYTQIVKEIE